VRKTHTLIQIAAALMADPGARHWGYDLSRRAGVRSGALYPVLQRMLDAGWLADGWEQPATGTHRPPRRYYKVTDAGQAQLGALLEAAHADARFDSLFSEEQQR